MAIYVTGDRHGQLRTLGPKYFSQQKNFTRNDYLIITGDFGGVWDGSLKEHAMLELLEARSFTTLFLDGNHENHAMLNAMPVEEWHGGKIHRVREHILHLMRGQVFEIGGMTFFTMGGAASHDIEDGILNPDDPNFEWKYRIACQKGGRYRILGVSWWPEEMPSDEEYAEAERNLDKAGWSVDIILTHCAPTSIALQMERNNESDKLTDFLEMVKRRCEYDYWFCGHYHRNMVFEDKMFLQYNQITMVEKAEIVNPGNDSGSQ